MSQVKRDLKYNISEIGFMFSMSAFFIQATSFPRGAGFISFHKAVMRTPFLTITTVKIMIQLCKWAHIPATWTLPGVQWR